METKSFIRSFIDLADAEHYLDEKITEHSSWGEVQEGSQIVYVNYQWRVGVSFREYER